MKNLANQSLKIPKNISILSNPNVLCIQGLEGKLCLDITFFRDQNVTDIKRKQKTGSFLSLFQKTLMGVDLSFVTRLAFIGVGFRVESTEKNLIKLKLGFSHFVFIKIPSQVKVFSPKKTLLVLKSLDDQLLKQFCVKICSFKLPDTYKGKGVIFKNQILILKEGKKK